MGKIGATGGTCTHTLELMSLLHELFVLPWRKMVDRVGLAPTMRLSPTD